MRKILHIIFLNLWFVFSLASGSDIDHEKKNLIKTEEDGVSKIEGGKNLPELGEVMTSNFTQTHTGSNYEFLNYMNLSSEVVKESADELIETSLLGIGALKMSLELTNQTQLQDLESVFNETYLKYKNEVAPVLEKTISGKKEWFSNIDLKIQEKLKELIVQNDETNSKKMIKNVPLNYINGIDVNKWYPLLDSINMFAISMLSGGFSDKKQTQNLNKKELQELVEKINNILVLFSMITSSTFCKQIAWGLVVGEGQSVSILNGISRKLIKRSQSSVSLLKSRNESVIKQHNLFIKKRMELDSNLKGLLDIIIKARSDELNSLIIVEDISQDLQSLKSHYLELNKEKSQWITSNRKLVKAFADWLQISVGLIYRVILGLSKSFLAYHIRNLSDLVLTLKENKGDLEEVDQGIKKSLDVFEFTLDGLKTGISSLRHEKNSEIFSQLLKKLQGHFLTLKKGYLETWNGLYKLIKESDPKAQLENFFESSKDLIEYLWQRELKNPFKFDSNTEFHNRKIVGLFKKVGEFLRSENVSKNTEIQNGILGLRYYNEMLFPDLKLQIQVLDKEKERFSMTGVFDLEKLEYLLNHTYLNELIEKCNTNFKNFPNNPTLRLGISNKMMTKTSMWEEESPLISGQEELKKLSTDFILEKRSKSLIKKFFETNLIGSDGSQENTLRNETIEKLLDLKEKLMKQNFSLQKELETLKEEGSELDSVTKPLLKKIQGFEMHIQVLESAISNIKSSDQENLDFLIEISQSFLNKEGTTNEILPNKERQTSIKKLKDETNRFKNELSGFKVILDKDLKVIKKISKYSNDISILDDNLKIMERFLSQIQARIDLFCGRIDKDGTSKTSRALSILKYTFRRKKPDNECESLTVEFSRAKEEISAFLKNASETVSEFYEGFRMCNEVEAISSRFNSIVNEFQLAKKELQILQSSYLNKSLDQGIKLLEKSMQKLSQDSKAVTKELKCYNEIISNPEVITMYIKNVRKEMFKLQNTIERELNNYIYKN
ncbi:uncharacterized protein cubi_00732 [Cryptosporidium ubiquitum]|uniref:Domain of unknown function WSN domain-containing protein n=1 Tax=Cryptosporidium ubiquitum TaxID=857276 RepID=A0A1J4MFW4_9CRYT|nr:uncharacterized protein cubi_00732 [Cryptosporidium ubiquitum]OII71924.1 hypothetical protein cubi_00732 [Cryptosporidium ubiquitum]